MIFYFEQLRISGTIFSSSKGVYIEYTCNVYIIYIKIYVCM